VNNVRKIQFIFGVHNHQPAGNFEFIFEKAVNNAYKPFVDTLFKFPEIKAVLHYSGPLLEYLDKKYPQMIKKIKTMLNRDQIELFTGGYYEPVMSVIPVKDRINQIKKMNEMLLKMFNYTAKGLWLSERIWEQSLVSTLSMMGIEYVALDDDHFKNAGNYEDELNGYFMTEDQGYPLKIFPINKKLRYLMPFHEVEDTVRYLQERSSENGQNMYLMFDDGEKFGNWPGTNDLVYKQKWLENFFKKISEESEWLTTTTFSKYAAEVSSRGRTYIPDSAYPEMMSWALPSRARTHYERLESELKKKDEFARFSMFLKTGFWRTFLAKYTESNLMHKKMLHLSSMVSDDCSEEIKDKLLRAQANDAYWHGLFGGLYLPNLRADVYKNLISVNKEIDKINHGDDDFVEIEIKDIDIDGHDEILMNNKWLTLGISPSNGGRIFEMSLKNKEINLMNNLTRRYEPYHEKMPKARIAEEGGTGTFLTKEKGLDKLLNYDWYERYSMLDHFLGEWSNLEKYARCRYPEQGDFTNQLYEYEIIDREHGGVRLTRDGHIWHGSLWIPIRIEKEIIFDEDGLLLKNKITNMSMHNIPIFYGCEYNINMLSDDSDERYLYSTEFNKMKIKDMGKIKSTYFGLRSEYEGLDISFQPDKEVEFWYFPVYTVSYSENGYEKIYQTTSVTPMYRFKSEPMSTFETETKLKIEEI
jgi:alpha-amylase